MSLIIPPNRIRKSFTFSSEQEPTSFTGRSRIPLCRKQRVCDVDFMQFTTCNALNLHLEDDLHAHR